jgi:hypothetical protein
MISVIVQIQKYDCVVKWKDTVPKMGADDKCVLL